MKKRTFAVDIDGTITENGGGRIHLDALESLRRLTNMGHDVIFVTGRSSVEGFLLSIFGGTTKISVGENGGGRIHLDALEALRRLTNMGQDVIFVTGRSSVEGFLLSVFGGTTKISVGENGGCITYGSHEHILLGKIEECKNALDVLKKSIDNVKEKPVFPRMTEVVLERTFDLDLARKVFSENNLDVVLSDSQYAYHVNSSGIDKGAGFREIMKKFSISRDDVIAIGDSATDIPLFKVAKTSIALGNASDEVKSEATLTVDALAGDGVLEALDKLAPKLSEL